MKTIHIIKSQVMTFLLFSGPVAGILTNKFGYRFVTILGALLEALGVFLTAFTPNLEFLYFSVGILIGKLIGFHQVVKICFSIFADFY